MIVLDTSAIISLVFKEPGAQIVLNSIGNSIINTVNYSELLLILKRKQADKKATLSYLVELGIVITDFKKSEAEYAVNLYSLTKPYGLSLADRACIATAIHYKLPVLTADRIWAKINYPELRITLIR